MSGKILNGTSGRYRTKHLEEKIEQEKIEQEDIEQEDIEQEDIEQEITSNYNWNRNIK
ncbi:hypothetical protein [Lachnoclostridium phytofermentans]|uniref:hypothetical protein n=1 Tax=Lachnoclostridium phytofermentans TaxID=66219 RepID=UPI000300CF2F|nr:hypothetical protein [Lachnoclostridium phytofermentans]